MTYSTVFLSLPAICIRRSDSREELFIVILVNRSFTLVRIFPSAPPSPVPVGFPFSYRSSAPALENVPGILRSAPDFRFYLPRKSLRLLYRKFVPDWTSGRSLKRKFPIFSPSSVFFHAYFLFHRPLKNNCRCQSRIPVLADLILPAIDQPLSII